MNNTQSSSLDFPSPKVVIPRNVYTKLMYWVAKGGSHECSGLGKTIFEDGKIKVVDAWMVKQKNTGGTTDMDEDAIATLLYEKRDVQGTMNFWWHSHANMGVFWSGTDREQINKIASNGFCLSIVFNQKRETLACVAFGQPIPMYVNGVSVTVEEPYDPEIIKSWETEYETAVQKPTYATHSGNSYYGYGQLDEDWSDRFSRFGHRGSFSRATELTGGNVIGFGGGSESPVAARVKRVKELDRQIELLDFLLEQKLPSFVSDTIKQIVGFPGLAETNPYADITLPDGTVTTWVSLAMDKQIELEEELDILVKEYKAANEVQKNNEGALTK